MPICLRYCEPRISTTTTSKNQRLGLGVVVEILGSQYRKQIGMTPRAAYIAHCELLGIHRSLAGLMADCAEEALPEWFGLSARELTAVNQLFTSFEWELTEQKGEFWRGVETMFLKMRRTGECK